MSDAIRIIQVHTAPPYTVSIGPGLLADCGSRLREALSPCRVAVITDSTVAPLYLNTVTAGLEAAGFAVCSFVFPAGESDVYKRQLPPLLAKGHKSASRAGRRSCPLFYSFFTGAAGPPAPPGSPGGRWRSGPGPAPGCSCI